MNQEQPPAPAAAVANARSWPYLVTLALAGVVAAIAIAFFVIGIADGSVSSFNINLWLGLLAVVAAVLGAGTYLRSIGRTRSAIAVLSLLAVPGLLYAAFTIVVIASGSRWN